MKHYSKINAYIFGALAAISFVCVAVGGAHHIFTFAACSALALLARHEYKAEKE